MVELAYKVVVNEEGFYSLLMANQPCPVGWAEVGKQGSRQECLQYIGEVWTDMTPLSIRQQLRVADNT